MSYIFDALQRAESESSGDGTATFSVATELLQAAERKIREAGAIDQQRSTAEAFDSTSSTSSLDDPDRCPVLSTSIQKESHLVALGKEESLGAEKFRFLAVRLRQIRQSRPLKKVLVTSSIPREGKSTVAANLACTLARRRQRRTLLLDGDLRRPTLTVKFGLGRIPGLCEWLSGETAGINLYRLDNLGLWVIPAGVAPENPLELMQSGKLPSLMDQLETWFDWIIIDSPPVLPLADASIWSRWADGILLVTRKGITEKKQLKLGLEAVEKSKLLGALVNSSSNTSHADYYQRYRYSSSPVDQSKEQAV